MPGPYTATTHRKEINMSKITVTKQFDNSADSLWARVGRPAGLADWHPAIATSRMSPDGRTRTCVLADGATITEEIVSHDDAARAYTYRIVGGPLPVEGYVSTLRVDDSPQGCAVTWESEFAVAPGAPVHEVEAMIRSVVEAGLSSL